MTDEFDRFLLCEIETQEDFFGRGLLGKYFCQNSATYRRPCVFLWIGKQ